MTRDEINKLLSDVPSWGSSDTSMKSAFVAAMRRNQYGYRPLRDAWDWFQNGWVSCQLKSRSRK